MVDKTMRSQEKRTRMSGTERRALILARAKQVFARHSYPEASTGELARESDITEPMLYKHFGSKKKLFLEVIEQFGARFTDLWYARVMRRAEADLLDALTHVILDYRSAIRDDPDIHKILLLALAESNDKDIAACVRAHNQNVYVLIRQLLERAQRDGLLNREIDLDAATWGYVGMVFAMQYGLILDLTEELNYDVLAAMSRIWLRGLQASS